ncbi:peptidylprolyl isomerase [Malassezia vespertilionis]|uniref:peptidylprolyl isomerase n=1 Tax=Malassezia vespertilionis TaxID=2020962 RepID=UPI0024B09944|nr:peptidylprolyl isomerase [Malassezia vespertilionis]WFD04947.1 peptidylprolyl isomerase [Malassezia vespertilionis]
MSVTLHTTLGDVKIELFCEAVPRAAENFLGLCASGAYDSVKWHRNMKGFMIQTGDPSGTGKGGQSIWGEPFADEIRATLKFHARGVVAMANNVPNSNRSQPHLDGRYTIIGKVIDGAEPGGTLDAMESAPVDAKHRPLEAICMTGVTVHANPIAQQAL